jgi:hypothetical protein
LAQREKRLKPFAGSNKRVFLSDRKTHNYMDEHLAMMLLQLLLPLSVIVAAILFLRSQYRTLEAIQPQNRRIEPRQVWLQMIPLFGLIWQYFVIGKIANSIREELNSPTGDSIFAEDTIPSDARPTFGIGLAYAICFSVCIIPMQLLKSWAALGGIICLIIYWVKLAQYKKKIKSRSMLLRAPL